MHWEPPRVGPPSLRIFSWRAGDRRRGLEGLRRVGVGQERLVRLYDASGRLALHNVWGLDLGVWIADYLVNAPPMHTLSSLAFIPGGILTVPLGVCLQ